MSGIQILDVLDITYCYKLRPDKYNNTKNKLIQLKLKMSIIDLLNQSRLEHFIQ